MVKLKKDQKNVKLPGTSKPQDFGATPGYKTTNLPNNKQLIQ